ncbi:MAG: protein-glutamate O-methyltransferase CheR [Magnetococcales bacterium]|nr:protein-glutamate O-methyltransferase CheR [Magnetococcales bacterium]
MTPEAIEQLELALLFEALFRRYGYDFRHYSKASARRRVLLQVKEEGVASISHLQHRVLHDEAAADRLVQRLSINVTEMFRDPPFFREIADTVLPTLRNAEHIKIWHAGCATGEELYSMAILLVEAGLYDRCRLYGTDFNKEVLKRAERGIFPLTTMRDNSRNYHAAGGSSSLSEHMHANYDHAVIDSRLKRNTLFAPHNLATDASFGEMNMIVCRNVLIYFEQQLQERVIGLFLDSLVEGGMLCLGSHETLLTSTHAERFSVVSGSRRIYRKKG